MVASSEMGGDLSILPSSPSPNTTYEAPPFPRLLKCQVYNTEFLETAVHGVFISTYSPMSSKEEKPCFMTEQNQKPETPLG